MDEERPELGDDLVRFPERLLDAARRVLRHEVSRTGRDRESRDPRQETERKEERSLEQGRWDRVRPARDAVLLLPEDAGAVEELRRRGLGSQSRLQPCGGISLLRAGGGRGGPLHALEQLGQLGPLAAGEGSQEEDTEGMEVGRRAEARVDLVARAGEAHAEGAAETLDRGVVELDRLGDERQPLVGGRGGGLASHDEGSDSESERLVGERDVDPVGLLRPREEAVRVAEPSFDLHAEPRVRRLDLGEVDVAGASRGEAELEDLGRRVREHRLRRRDDDLDAERRRLRGRGETVQPDLERPEGRERGADAVAVEEDVPRVQVEVRLPRGAIEREEAPGELPKGRHLQVEDLDRIDTRAVVPVEEASGRRERRAQPLEPVARRLRLEALGRGGRDEVLLRPTADEVGPFVPAHRGEPAHQERRGTERERAPARGEVPEGAAARGAETEGFLGRFAGGERLHLALVPIPEERPGEPLQQLVGPAHRDVGLARKGRIGEDGDDAVRRGAARAADEAVERLEVRRQPPLAQEMLVGEELERPTARGARRDEERP